MKDAPIITLSAYQIVQLLFDRTLETDDYQFKCSDTPLNVLYFFNEAINKRVKNYDD